MDNSILFRIKSSSKMIIDSMLQNKRSKTINDFAKIVNNF